MRERVRLWGPVAIAVLAVAAFGNVAQADYLSALASLGPVSNWRLNETSGTTAADAITTDTLDGNNPGTYYGAGYTLGVGGPTPANGFAGFAADNKAVSFADDANTRLEMTDDAYLPTTGVGLKDLSIVTWLKYPSVPTSSGDRRTVGGLQRDASSSKYIMATGFYNPTPDGLQMFLRRSDGTTVQSTRYLPAGGDKGVNAWHMWVITFDAGQVGKCYLDGVLKETGTFANGDYGLDNTNTVTGLIFGNDIQSSVNRPWKGELDEIAIFGRALTGTDVANLWTAATVPEPASLALLAIGALCLAAFRRR
jgi:hypothetical protein